jgi:hypothetical protein
VRPRPVAHRADLALERREEGAQAHLAERPRQHGVHDLADEVRDARLVEPEPRLERGAVVGDELARDVAPGRIVSERGGDRAPQEVVRARIEAADDAPVDDADAPVAEEEHVPGVHVAVEHAVAERHHEPAAHHLLHDRTRVDAELGHAREVVDGDAVEEVHREHALPRERRQRLRDHDVREDPAPAVGGDGSAPWRAPRSGGRAPRPPAR